MRAKIAIGVGAIAVTVALTGCSGATSTRAQGGVQTAAAGTSQGGASPTATIAAANMPTSAAPTSAATSSARAQPKPVSALLAGIAAPITTANMPKAKPEWIASVQKTDDLGQAGPGTSLLNLAGLVDEAAKTSDLDALLKMCNLCDAQKLQQMLTATDNTGLTGFQELSRVLEQTHPAPSYTESSGWDFPGFSRPEKGAATKLDQQDMKLLGVTARPYAGMRAQFMNLNDGPKSYDGWTGLGSPNT